MQCRETIEIVEVDRKMKQKNYLQEKFGTWPFDNVENREKQCDLPVITMVTDSFQQAEFLERCILSVLNQNYPALEYIIFDGGSTDGSKEILQKYSDRLTYWQSCPDGGQVRAVNTAFAEHGRGEIFGLLDSDDLLTPGALLAVGRYFRDHPECDWLMGRGVYFDEKGNFVREDIPDTLDAYILVEDWTHHTVCQPSCFFRRKLWEQLNGYREDVYRYINDHELLVRAARNGRGAVLNELLSLNLFRKKQISQKYRFHMYMEEQLLRFEYGNKDAAAQGIKRVGTRALEFASIFRFITENPVYRKWREKSK